MGIACKINRNSNGTPVSVTTEAGGKSNLFEAALELTKDPQNALQVYATIFTDEFIEDVLNPAVKRAKDKGQKSVLDENGEPSLPMVTKYIGAKNREGKTLNLRQTLDIKETLQNIPDLRQKIVKAFVKDGLFVVDKDKIRASGLYNTAELNAIMYNPALQGKIKETVESYLNTSSEQLGETELVFRGEGNNISQGSNEGFDWVALDKSVAANYASMDNSGARNISERIIKKPRNIFRFPYKTNVDVRGEDIGNQLRTVLRDKFKSGEISSDEITKISEAIGNYEELAGENLEKYHTKVNKPEASKKLSSILGKLGFDAVAIQEESINGELTDTYGLIRKPIHFQIMGESGAVRLDQFEEGTKRMDNLGTAKSMENMGFDPLRIKMATGWERGADKKWRYETQDISLPASFFKENDTAPSALHSSEGLRDYKLKEVIGDNPILKAYPSVGEITIKFTNSFPDSSGNNIFLNGSSAFYHQGINTIVFNSDIIAPTNAAKINNTLVHEVQHAIQYSEGFSTGGGLMTMFINEDLTTPVNPSNPDRVRVDPRKVDIFINKERGRLARGISEIQEQLKTPFPTKAELQRAGLDKRWEYLKEMKSTLLQWSVFPDNEYYAFLYYRSLAGEVEARNVQDRTDFTPERRRETLLEATEDVARKDQVFLRQGLSPNQSFEIEDMEMQRIKEQGVFAPIIERLKKSGLAEGVHILNNQEIEAKIEEIKVLYNVNPTLQINDKGGLKELPNGFVFAGEVYLNSDKMNLDTPIHEFGHLWINWAAKNRPSLYNRGMELIEKEGKEYVKLVLENQPGIAPDLLYDEALAQAIGDNGALFVRAAQKKSFKEWLTDLWENIKGALGLSEQSADRVAKMSLEQFSEAVAIDLLKGTNEPFITRPYTIQPLLDDMLANKNGKMVSVQTIKQIIKQKGTKKIEKDIIEEILELPGFKGRGKIPFNLFEKEVQDRLLPLKVIVTGTYATYGDGNVGEFFDKQETHLYNTHLNHGKKGHFNADFEGNYENKEFQVVTQGDTHVVVEKGNWTQDNIQDHVYHASSSLEEANEWIRTFDRNNKINAGLFGHTRVWYAAGKAYVAELQSDAFQQTKAEDLLMDSYMKDPKNAPKEVMKAMKEYEAVKDRLEKQMKDRTVESLVWGSVDSVLTELSSQKHIVAANKDDSRVLDTVKREGEFKVIALEMVKKNLFEVISSGKAKLEPTVTELEDGTKIYSLYHAVNYGVVLPDGTVATPGKAWTPPKNEEALKDSYTKEGQTVKKYFEDFDLKVYEQYFRDKKELPKKKEAILKSAPIEDQQWVAHRKNYVERLLREEIRRSADLGMDQLLVPTPRTLAIIEGYSSNDNENMMPYEIEEADDHERLEPGDKIYYGGDELMVIYADAYDIAVAESTYVYSINPDAYVREEAEYFSEEDTNELADALVNEFGEFVVITEQQWEDFDKHYRFEQASIEDIAEEVEDPEGENEETKYKVVLSKAENWLKEHLIENLDAEELLQEQGYSEIHEHGGEIFYVDYGTHTFTLKQPDEYEEAADAENFDIEDYDEEQQTVLRKYEELVELFKKERPDAEIITDKYDNEWISTDLTKEDGVKPVVLFQMGQTQPKQKRKLFTPDKIVGETNSLGQHKTANPHQLEKEARQLLGGIQDRQEFEELLQESSFETLKDQYNSSPAFAEELFQEMSTMTRLREFKVDGDKLSRRMNPETAEVFENTLETEVDNGVNELITFLETIPEDIWTYNGSDVTPILKKIREKAVEMGLNLQNLEDLYFERSQDELINLLVAVKNINLQPNKVRFQELVQAYETFYDIKKEASVKVQNVNEREAEKSLIALDTTMSEYEVFDKFSLLPIEDNVYQKVQKPESLDTMYAQLAEAVLADPATLPIEVKSEDPIAVQKQIKSFVIEKMAKVDSSTFNGEQVELMTALKFYFKSDFNKVVTLDSNKEQLKHNNFTGDTQYLATQFVADFNKASIREQQKGSELYEDFYSNFKINHHGVVLENTDPLTMEKVRAYVESGLLGENISNNLIQYSIFSKNSNLDLVTEAESTYKSTDFYRDFFVNNPSQATRVENYTPIKPGVIAAKSAPQFVRTAEGVFEAIEGVGDVNFYGKLPKPNANYNKFGVEKPELGINIQEYAHLQTIPVAGIRVNNKYSKGEEFLINEEHFECE